MDVATWLADLGLDRYAASFAENDIDGETARHLTDADLKEIGVASLGHRKRLLAAIAALTTEVTEPPSGGPAPTSPAGERRQVTILFADISGFTKLSSERDPEETHALLTGFFKAVDGTVAAYGGAIDKHIGDSVMAVFGAPVAHSDDPERAVRAAFEIHRAVAGLEPPIRAHVGIASGQVVASGIGSEAHQEYTVTGDSVNLASRLQDMAAPTETLVSEAVYRALAALVEAEAVEDVAVKGLGQLVRVWRVRGLRPKDDGWTRRPLVGRRAELVQFAGAIDACRQIGRGQTIYVRGEAGIGKTRLLDEFQAIAEGRGFVCHTGLVLDFGVGRGQDAIGNVVRGMLSIPAGADQATRADAIARALEEGLLSADREVFLNDLLDLPQPTELRAIYDAMDNAHRNQGKQQTVVELVARASARQPTVIRIEDIHWAKPLELDRLAALAVAAADCPTVLVMTSRVDGDPLDSTWRSSTRGSPLTTIDLGPLRDEEALELAGEYIDATNRFAMTCVTRAEGNPLFLEQLLRSAEETSEESVPDSVQSIVQARMDSLAPIDKQALQAASVIGQRFSLDLLRHVIGQPQYGCAELVRHRLVRPEGDAYLFAHALIRDGVHASLLKTNRAALHRHAADWFEDLDPVLRAQHLDHADDERAAGAYLIAAGAATAEFRFESALNLAERGAAVARDDGETFGLLCQQGELLRRLGRPRHAIEKFEDALNHSDDAAQRCTAWIGIAAAVRLLGGYDQGIEALDQAEPVARRLGLDAKLSQIHYYRGAFYFSRGDVAGCLEQHQRALDHADRAGDPEWAARAYGGLGDGYYAHGRMAAALDAIRRCLAICREHGFGEIEVANRGMLGGTRRYMNEFEAGFADVKAAAEMADKVANRRARMYALLATGEFLVDRGEAADAEAPLAEALELAEAIGNERFKAHVMCQQGRRLLAEDEVDKAMATLSAAIAVSRATAIAFIGPRILAALARATREPAECRRFLAEGEEIIRQGVLAHNALGFYRDAIDACLAGGDWPGARAYADALTAFTRDEPLPWCTFFAARGHALAAHGAGARDDATIRELERLRAEGAAVGQHAALPAIDAALAAG